MSDIRVQFFINFQSLMLKQCPDHIKNNQCNLRFVRGANDLQTKKSQIDGGGFAEFNEKIEMKTFIEWDASAGKYKDKMAQLQAVFYDGTTLGSCDLNLADFAKPDKYLQNLPLSNTAPGVSTQSFIVVDIKTVDAAKAAADTGSGKKSSMLNKMGKALFNSSSQSSKQINVLTSQVEKLTRDNDNKLKENDQLKKNLVDMGVTVEDQVQNSLKDRLSQKMGVTTKVNVKRDNTEKYKALSAATAADVKQLVSLDKETERLFEMQMRKRNKNDEMVRNKINDLNEKPALRDFLFKQVSDQQLKKDIDEIEDEIDRLYAM